MQADGAASSPDYLDAEALFRQHARFVAGFVGRLGFRGQDVDDIVQETFLIAHQRGGYRAGVARPTTWLAEIAMRVSMAQWRKRRRTSVLADTEAWDAVPSEQAGPQDRMDQAQTIALVHKALDSMAMDRRAVFVLFELEGETCDAIASAFGIPVGTVYSRLHTARKEFMKAYQRLTAARARSVPPLRGRLEP